MYKNYLIPLLPIYSLGKFLYSLINDFWLLAKPLNTLIIFLNDGSIFLCFFKMTMFESNQNKYVTPMQFF